MAKIKFKKSSEAISSALLKKKARQETLEATTLPKLKFKFDKSTIMLLVSFVVLLALLAAVFVARHFFVSDKANMYNGFVIKKGADNLWHLKVAGEGTPEIDVPLHYHPSELNDVEVYGDPRWFFKLINKYGLNGAYVSFNPAQPGESFSYVALAASEVSLSMRQAFNVEPIAACTAKTKEGVCSERPVADCSTDDRMVVFLEESPINRTQIIEETNCIRVVGSGWNLVKAAEKMLYIWYGVM